MRYLELKEKLEEFKVFSLNDIRKIEPSFYGRRLNEWQKKGYIKKVIRGFYIFSELEINEPTLFVIANRVYEPSYISLEMALSFYGLIPEGVYSITSVGTKKTSDFRTGIANFSYKKIKPSLFFGYTLIEDGSHIYKMAELEKAILDYLYYNPRIKTRDDFSGVRLNKQELKKRLDFGKLRFYLDQFDNNLLEKRVAILLKYIVND